MKPHLIRGGYVKSDWKQKVGIDFIPISVFTGSDYD